MKRSFHTGHEATELFDNNHLLNLYLNRCFSSSLLSEGVISSEDERGMSPLTSFTKKVACSFYHHVLTTFQVCSQ